jgi:hypothetical protein
MSNLHTELDVILIEHKQKQAKTKLRSKNIKKITIKRKLRNMLNYLI